MAIRSKGSRSLVVDGHDYRWRIRKQPTDLQMCHGSPLLVAVQRVACKARLVIELPHARPDAPIAPAAVAVTPRHVSLWIRRGIAAGWCPESNGATFVLRADPSECVQP